MEHMNEVDAHGGFQGFSEGVRYVRYCVCPRQASSCTAVEQARCTSPSQAEPLHHIFVLLLHYRAITPAIFLLCVFATAGKTMYSAEGSPGEAGQDESSGEGSGPTHAPVLLQHTEDESNSPFGQAAERSMPSGHHHFQGYHGSESAGGQVIGNGSAGAGLVPTSYAGSETVRRSFSVDCLVPTKQHSHRPSAPPARAFSFNDAHQLPSLLEPCPASWLQSRTSSHPLNEHTPGATNIELLEAPDEEGYCEEGTLVGMGPMSGRSMLPMQAPGSLAPVLAPRRVSQSSHQPGSTSPSHGSEGDVFNPRSPTTPTSRRTAAGRLLKPSIRTMALSMAAAGTSEPAHGHQALAARRPGAPGQPGMGGVRPWGSAELPPTLPRNSSQLSSDGSNRDETASPPAGFGLGEAGEGAYAEGSGAGAPYGAMVPAPAYDGQAAAEGAAAGWGASGAMPHQHVPRRSPTHNIALPPGWGLPEVPPPRTNRTNNKKRGAPGNGSTCAKPAPCPPGHSCTACGTQTTPVWRTGPYGPKTLCNACGVRYMKVARKK